MAVILSERIESGRGGRLRLQHSGGRRSGVARAVQRTVRSIGQVVMFGVFGVCGALIGAVVLPLTFIAIRDPARRIENVRRVVYYAARAYIGSLHRLRLIDLELNGLGGSWRKDSQSGSLVVANHPSLIDALILLGLIRGGVVVAKRSLQINPFTWGSIYGANYVVNAGASTLVAACLERIAAGETLVLFPECTRTADDGVIRLRRGAAQIAVRTGCPVVPVTIEYSEPLLTKSSRWWLAPVARPRVRVVRHESIDPAQFLHGGASVTLAARRLNEHLQALYMKELSGRESA
jgi:1-acyl-sn-glycerol-3-phosphate acyltransferase